MYVTINRYQLLSNFFSLGTVQAISSLVQLIVIPHVISSIGVAGYGVVAVAQVVMFYLAAITDYSFNQTATRDISVNRAEPGIVSAIFSRVLFSRLILCAIAFIVLLLLIGIIPFFRSNLLLYLMAFSFVIGHAALINWFFLGIERMHIIAVVTLIARFIFAVLVFMFIRDSGDGYLFLFFLGLGNMVAALISLVIVFRTYSLCLKWPGVSGIVSELKEGWQVTISHLSNSTCHYANIFILRIFSADLLVGYYAIAERIFFTIRQVFVVFSQAVYPRLCQALEQGRSGAVSFLIKPYSLFLMVVIPGAILLFIFCPYVLYFFMGNEYPHAVIYMRIFCFIAVIVCLNIPGTLLMFAANQKTEYLRVYLLATVLNITLNLVLAGYYHAYGTLMAIFITEAFITIAVTYFAGRIQVKPRKTPGHQGSIGF